jgi:hypothetical protein
MGKFQCQDCTQTYGFRNIKYEENIRFPFLYLTMGATEVGYVSTIDIKRGTRRFGREHHEKNAPNVWF